MKNTDYLIDPDEVANLIHHNVESGFSHTTYREELERFAYLENGDDNPYTDPDEAKEFVARCNPDSLAVGVGTSHGVYKGVPKVNVEVLSAIRKVVDIPLVLHGTSGVPDEQVKDCISRGICKVNYATDLRIAFTRGVKAHMEAHPDDFDPKKYCAPAMEEIKKYVIQKMEVVGSVGKA